MKRSRAELGLVSALVFWGIWIAFPGTSSATLPIQKKAKEAGFPATTCQYCHVEKLPKKDAATHNERSRAGQIAQRIESALGAPFLDYRDGNDN